MSILPELVASQSSQQQESLAYRALRCTWRTTAKPAVVSLRATLRIVRNAAMRTMCRSDYRRWSTAGGLEQWWDARTERLGKLVPPGSRVIEFGAGRRQLESFLPAGCSYTPSDLVDRGPGTIVCDLNARPLPDLRAVSPQVAVFGGVLEYVGDVPGVIRWLEQSHIATVIMSYDAVPENIGPLRRAREKLRRTYYGYMSSLSERELFRVFDECGFTCAEKHVWTSQRIYRFTRRTC